MRIPEGGNVLFNPVQTVDFKYNQTSRVDDYNALGNPTQSLPKPSTQRTSQKRDSGDGIRLRGRGPHQQSPSRQGFLRHCLPCPSKGHSSPIRSQSRELIRSNSMKTAKLNAKSKTLIVKSTLINLSTIQISSSFTITSG